jgi:hypothetical protein
MLPLALSVNPYFCSFASFSSIFMILGFNYIPTFHGASGVDKTMPWDPVFAIL